MERVPTLAVAGLWVQLHQLEWLYELGSDQLTAERSALDFPKEAS